MIEFFTSDTALVFFSGFGLMVTTVSIVRETRAQRPRPVIHELPLAERQENIAA